MLVRRGCEAVLAAVMAVFLTACAGGTAQVEPAESAATGGRLTIRIDVRVTHQRIDGFGASERVWNDPHLADDPSPVVPPQAQEEILSTLFRRLGLTRLRPIIDPGVERENDNSSPLVIDPSGFNFSGKLGDAHIAVVKQAKRYGLQTFFPAPVYLEKWIREGGGSPEEHAEWVLANLLHWRSLGLEPPLVSPLNEPRITGDLPADWFRRMVVALGPRMRAAGLDTKLVIPDDENPVDAYERAAAVLADPAARPYVAALAYHLYRDRGEIEPMRQLAARYGLPVWMTEWTNGSFDRWPEVLEWAVEMHELLTRGGVSAIDYLWGFFGSWVGGDTMVSIDFDGGRYEGFSVTPVGFVTSQFARFVRPGFRRVEATERSGQVRAVAFRGPGRVVVVAINPGDDPQALELVLAGATTRAKVQVTRTSERENAKRLAAIAPGPSTVKATLAPESVTTFVLPVRFTS